MKAILLTLAKLAQKIIMLSQTELLGGYVGRGKKNAGGYTKYNYYNVLYYVTFIDLKTLDIVKGRKIEISVDPYFVAIRE
jgi:hypothetical protein